MTTEQKSVAGKPTMTVAQIMERHTKSRVYVVRSLQRGWLKGHKVLMGSTKVEQWVAFTADVEAWRKSAESHKSPKAQFAGTPRQLKDLSDWVSDPATKIEDIAALRKSLEALREAK